MTTMILFVLPLTAQDNEMKYRRSSLDVVFVTNYNQWSHAHPAPEYLLKSYVLPDKYNEHSVGARIVDLSRYPVTDNEVSALFPKYKAYLKSHDFWLSRGSHDTDGELKIDDCRIGARINKYLKESNIPVQLMQKWFNQAHVKKDGSYFNMDLILERGAYNASTLDVIRSNESVRGESILQDAGMELIPNTFILFVALEIRTSKEVLGRASEGGMLGDLYKMINVTSEGYYVIARTYLYQLNWTEQDSETLFTRYWDTDDPNNVWLTKIKPTVTFLGKQQSLSEVVETDDAAFTNMLRNKIEGGNSSQRRYGRYSTYVRYDTRVTKKFNKEDLLVRATNRAIDQAIVLLQKEYEDFKVKTPIAEVAGKYATAFIGLKEGVTSGAKFDILEQYYNEEKNTFKYKKVGTLKVAKDKIWDNRFNIEGLPDDSDSSSKKEDVDRTYFTGDVSKATPGMLIRQIK